MVKLTAKFSFMEEYKLSDIAEVRTGPFGSQLHNEDYVSTGTPIVTVEHLGNRRFSKQNLPLVSDDDKKRLSKYLLQEGDIVFSRVGSVDRCSYVTSAENDWLFSGRCLRVRCGNNCHPLFLYYYFCKESVKQYIKSIAVGATMPSINTKLMAEIPILLPKLEEQRCIADILSSFDDKIELNRRINDNFDWHDSILNSVIINRQNLGLNDIVELDITWPSGERGILLFENVRKCIMDLNSGTDTKDWIYNAYETEDDEDFVSYKKQVENICNDIDKLKCFVIETSTTGSLVKIFATQVIERLSDSPEKSLL